MMSILNLTPRLYLSMLIFSLWTACDHSGEMGDQLSETSQDMEPRRDLTLMSEMLDRGRQEETSSLSPPSSLKCSHYGPPFERGLLEGDTLSELSGLTMSSLHSNLLWAHNDAGNSSAIYALDEMGKLKATVNLSPDLIDFEDIDASLCPTVRSIGFLDDRLSSSLMMDMRAEVLWGAQGLERGCIWVADVGDNDQRREDVSLYLYQEPTLDVIERVPPESPPTLNMTPLLKLKLTYPHGPIDAEGLFVERSGRRAWIVEKTETSELTIWEADLSNAGDPSWSIIAMPTGEAVTLLELNLTPTPHHLISPHAYLRGRMEDHQHNKITGADLSSMDDHLILRTLSAVFEYTLLGPGLISSLDEITPSVVIDETTRQWRESQGEAVTYGWRDRGIWTASEDQEGAQPISWLPCVD